MMIKIVCCLLFSVSISFAQYSREEKLQQLKSRTDIKVTEIEKDILKLEYPQSKVIYKNIGDYQYPESGIRYPVSPTFDSTIIDLTTIDTTLYYHKYSLWQEVPLHNSDFDFIRISDVNNNTKPELYGARKFFDSDYEPVAVYELNNAGSFDSIYQYDSVFNIRAIYDVDLDEKEEVLLTLPPIFGDSITFQQRFFSKPTDSSLATELNFIFAPFTFHHSQLNDIILGDFDKDETSDILFVKANQLPMQIYIFEYNSAAKIFDSVYRFTVNDPVELDAGGFSVGDFDLDGKTDIVFSTIRGKVFVIENESDNQYQNVWQGNVESYNAYIHTWTNDIDGNGKPEFWVLADGTFSGTSITRITIFEANGNNSYQVVGRIDLIGVFSFYAGNLQAIDIDADGVEEVAICIDGNFLILKFNGSKNHHTYEVYYIKQNELNTEEEWQTYFGATMYDLQNDAKPEVLISMGHTINTQPNIIGRRVTKIYRPDSTTNVNDDEIFPMDFNLFQNYPNPFNPITNIRFQINKSETVFIKVYNILGKEIKLVLDKNLLPGEYTIQWDGKDNEGNLLPSGIYFIKVKAGEHQQIIKSVLLK